jgi:hypothetical protein
VAPGVLYHCRCLRDRRARLRQLRASGEAGRCRARRARRTLTRPRTVSRFLWPMRGPSSKATPTRWQATATNFFLAGRHRGRPRPWLSRPIEVRGRWRAPPSCPAGFDRMLSPSLAAAGRSAQANTLKPRLTSAARFKIASAPLGMSGAPLLGNCFAKLRSFATN